MPNPSIPRKIRLPSGYTCQLRGKTGTRTAEIILQGVFNANWNCFIFDVEATGFYDLYFDVNGGSNYTKDSVWSGTYGNLVDGYDFGASLG